MSTQSFTSTHGRASCSPIRLFAIVLIIVSSIVILAIPSFGQWQVTTLYSLYTPPGTAGGTAFGVVEGADGAVYGTAINAADGYIFEIAADGTATTLYSFSGPDGAAPGTLTLNTDGYFYGACSIGGDSGNGTTFRMDPSGNLTVLHKFDGADGSLPGALTLAQDGNFYGTTGNGGADSVGTVFRMTPQGDLTTLYSFTGGQDGASPWGYLTIGSDGALYGVTRIGGDYDYGVIYRMTTAGAFNVVYAFASSQEPSGALVLANDGNLYGVQTYGGANGLGDVFRLSSTQGFQTLYSFSGGSDGEFPSFLTLASDGALYGTAQTAGSDASGTIFRITTNGSLSTLYTFPPNGNYPTMPNWLMQASNGSLYGSTGDGGTYDAGSVFEMTGSLPNPATHFTVSMPLSASIAQPAVCTVTALDKNGNTAATYPGTVYVTSSDPAAEFPPTATFTNGIANISMALFTAGSQTVYVADTTTPTVNGTSAATNVALGDMNTFSPGLQMFSAPADFSGRPLDQIFSISGVTLAVWQPSGGQYIVSPTSPADTVHTGVGYWARFPASATLYDLGHHTDPSTAIGIPLTAGWNMIGDPFATSVPLTSLQVNNGSSTVSYSNALKSGLLGADIYTYPAGATAYQVEQNALQPYVGYWILASEGCTLIVRGS